MTGPHDAARGPSGLRARLRRTPVVGPAAAAGKALLARLAFPGSATYWERRYAGGGSAGPGSRGELAVFKAAVVNDFVRAQGIGSVIEFGCGDGEQLALAEYPAYIGLDVSPSALRRCRERFGTDATKSFFLYDPACFVDHHGLFRADLALSLDVIFHLVEDTVFEAYMRHLFAAARRFVVIYSKDTTELATVGYVRNRRFTPWVAAELPDWRLHARLPNRHPWRGDVRTGSQCDFFIYRRAAAAA